MYQKVADLKNRVLGKDEAIAKLQADLDRKAADCKKGVDALKRSQEDNERLVSNGESWKHQIKELQQGFIVFFIFYFYFFIC